MSEQDRHDHEIDQLLRRSLAAPVPRLSTGFDQRLSRKLLDTHPRSERLLLISYALLSAVTSVVVMRSQGLGWTVIAAMVLAPLAVALFGLRAATGSPGRDLAGTH